MLKALITGVIALVIAVWTGAIALISIQNVLIPAADGEKGFVVLKFLGLTSIELPFGLTLAFSAAVGMVGTAVLLPLIQTGRGSMFSKNRSQPRRPRSRK